jgi:protoheme IX farnesyltransferase
MNGEAKVISKELLGSRSKVLDLLELMKPELTGLSVLTVLCGYYLGTRGGVDILGFLWTGLGTMLVGGGAGALNQYIEREYDSMMKRTERRPLPARRLQPATVLLFGTTISVFGIVLLTTVVDVLTGLLATLTITSYLFVYTPLKRLTPHATLIGGVPGALPPLMGWTAASGRIELGGLVLFAILFFWQMPHFLSLAWMYKKDYARAGYRILSVLDADGKRTASHCFIHIITLIPATLALPLIGVSGWFYTASALVLGAFLLIYGYLFLRSADGMEGTVKLNNWSRRLFFASLIYLPVLMIGMVIDKV